MKNVAKVGPDRWKVRSHTDRRKKYTVVRRKRHFLCDCWRWRTTVPRTNCKHIDDVKGGAR